MADPTTPLLFNADDIVETVRQPMLVLGADLRVRRANRSFCRTFQVTPEESIGKLVYELGNRQWDIPALRSLLEVVLPQNTAFDDFEVVHEFARIGRKVMLLNARRVYQAGNQIEFILLAIEDITERRRLEDERREPDANGTHTGHRLRLQADLMDKVGEAVIVTDAAGTITHWNAFAESLYGWTKAEAIGRNVLDIVVTEVGAKPAEEVMDRLRQGQSWSGEFQVRRRDGTIFPIHVTNTPMMNARNEVEGIIGVSIDFSERKLAEAAFRESEQRFRALMEQAPFSVQVFSPDGRTIRVNRAWEDLWGVTLDQLADYNILKDPQLEQKGVLEFIRRGFSGESAHIPAIQYNPDETIPGRTQHEDPSRWVAAIIYPLKDTAGVIREVVLVHDDITARKRAEEALLAAHREMEERVAERTAELARTNEFLQTLLENIQDGIVACDAQGVLTLFNHVTRELHGIPEEAIHASEWAERYRLYRPDGQTLMAKEDVPLYRALQGERVRDAEMVIVPDQQRPRTVLASGQAFFDAEGTKLGAVVSMHEITERKLAEDALRQAHADLERRVHDRTVELAHANDALLGADRRKDEFLATLAHELRNPLAPIRNALQILNMPRVDGETARRSREMIERQVHQLVRLVDDLLDVSRVMGGKIELRRERVELASVVARAVETVQPILDAQGHQLTIRLPPESLALDADPVRLAQVIGNLLTNAAKYTDANGQLSLTAERDQDVAVLRVADNGIGIDPGMLDRIFELFVQVDHASTKAQGGLGIGLTLVKNLVEMHHGSVEARSKGLGQGTEFVVRLPTAAHQVHAGHLESGHRADPVVASGNRLLIVDDNRDAAESLAMLFTLQGHEVRVAHSGAAALEMTRLSAPDVVFLDIGMPGMDGYEVARRMRQQPGMEHVVLAALTGWGQQEDRRRTAEAGFDYHLVKPPTAVAIEAVLADSKRRRDPKTDVS